MTRSDTLRLRSTRHGAVQWVGFRPFIYCVAKELRLNGWARNSGQGLDPLYVATEGRLAGFRPAEETERAIEIPRRFEPCCDALRVGTVMAEESGTVIAGSSVGGNRVLDMLSGERLPRICRPALQ